MFSMNDSKISVRKKIKIHCKDVKTYYSFPEKKNKSIIFLFLMKLKLLDWTRP